MSEPDDRVGVTADDVWPSDAEVDEGVVVNWFKREGATVSEGETLCEIQVEKVSLDIPSPVEGTLAKVLLDEDDEFERTATLAYIEQS